MSTPSVEMKKSKTRFPAMDPQEARFRNISLQLAEEQLAQIERQAELSKYLFERAPQYFDQLAESGALDENNFVDRIDQIRANIGSYAENALRLGEADINRQTRIGLEGVRDVLAPERGLRPGDSPILGLGSDIVREGLYNQGQLTRAIRGQEALQLANFDQASTEFQAELAQQAFNNRLALAGGVGSLGIGLNSEYNVLGGLAAATTPRFMMGSTRSKSGGIVGSSTGELLGGAGSLLGGLSAYGGAAGAAAACWVAAEYFGWDTPEWHNARRWIMERWQGALATVFRSIYLRCGPRIAGWVRRSRVVRSALRPIFVWAERRGR